MLNKKNMIIIVAIVFMTVVIGYVLSRSYSIYGNKIDTVMIGKRKFQIEVVSSSDKMQKGLGGRKGLCSSCGMLFQFTRSGKHPFWMKDMRFPLDMIWIANGKIVHIEKNVSEEFSGILAPPVDADNVLEINAGDADKLGIEIGDKIQT